MREEKAKIVMAGLPDNVQISDHTYRFYYQVGHALPCTIFTDVLCRDVWKQLSSWYVPYVQNMEVDYPILEEEDILSWWRELSDDAILGFYDGLGRTQTHEAEVISAASALVYIAALCKDVNEKFLHNQNLIRNGIEIEI